MGLFGLSKEEVQKRIDDGINAVDASLRREYDGQLARERKARMELEQRLSDAETARKANATQFSAELASVGGQLAEHQQQRATSQTLGTINQPSSITFASVLEMAATVSDEGYQRVRDFFMVEAAKRGYQPLPVHDNHARLRWSVEDSDSGLGIYFVRGHTFNAGKLATHKKFDLTNTTGSEPQLHQLGSGQLIDFSDSEYHQLRENGKILVLLDERVKTESDSAATYSLVAFNRSRSDSAWKRRLQDDLPEIFKAHIFGVALSYLDGTNPEVKTFEVGKAGCYDRAALLMHRHGLETCTPLLRRVAEHMQTDAVLAGALMTHYDADAAQLRLPLSYRNV